MARCRRGGCRTGDVDLTINISGRDRNAGPARLRRSARKRGWCERGALRHCADQNAPWPTRRKELALALGRPAVLVGVLAQDGVQIDRWMSFVREELQSGQNALPHGITETLMFDQSTYTADRLAEVGMNMAIGVSLVVAVLFVTLGVRAAAIVAVVLARCVSGDAGQHELSPACRSTRCPSPG